MKNSTKISPLFIFYAFILLLFVSCQGYRVNDQDNPLISYDIQSISVPMFINRSVIPNANGPMTQEIINVLNQYQDLKVGQSLSENYDSVLIGIIDSKEKINEAFLNKDFAITNSLEGIGNRPDFYYPSTVLYDLTLQIIIIKKPTAEELAVLKSDLSKYIQFHPKIVVRETLLLSSSFQKVANDTVANGGGDVNYVKNNGNFEKSLIDLSRQAAISFRDMVLNVF